MAYEVYDIKMPGSVARDLRRRMAPGFEWAWIFAFYKVTRDFDGNLTGVTAAGFSIEGDRDCERDAPVIEYHLRYNYETRKWSAQGIDGTTGSFLADCMSGTPGGLVAGPEIIAWKSDEYDDGGFYKLYFKEIFYDDCND